MGRKVRRAIISVWDKSGLDSFAKRLAECGVEIISTGGTLRKLVGAGVPAKSVSEVTGFPEILSGRVKTLHPAVHAAILADVRVDQHRVELERLGIEPVQLVVVNLYPFFTVAARKDAHLDEVIENIDIGGPAMIRAAAKNHENVTVVVDPMDYDAVIAEIEASGDTSLELRRRLAAKAFLHTAIYDQGVSNYLRQRFSLCSGEFPDDEVFAFKKAQDLRYGENPHQKAALYRAAFPRDSFLDAIEKVAGKELSYNNILDIYSAVSLVWDLGPNSAVIIKHNNPCGAAKASSPEEAFRKALECDPVSAFGGIVAISAEVGIELALMLTARFFEVVIAEGYSAEAMEELRRKEKMTIIRLIKKRPSTDMEFRWLDGCLLAQEKDDRSETENQLSYVTKIRPSGDQVRDLLFAMRVCKHVKSNAIVLAKGQATVGIGAGQMSRLDSVRIATAKAGERANGAVLASDAFFPFRDCIDEAARAGIAAVIQPGGSIRDEEVISAAESAGIPMVFTGIRHFRH